MKSSEILSPSRKGLMKSSEVLSRCIQFRRIVFSSFEALRERFADKGVVHRKGSRISMAVRIPHTSRTCVLAPTMAQLLLPDISTFLRHLVSSRNPPPTACDASHSDFDCAFANKCLLESRPSNMSADSQKLFPTIDTDHNTVCKSSARSTVVLDRLDFSSVPIYTTPIIFIFLCISRPRAYVFVITDGMTSDQTMMMYSHKITRV